MKRVRWIKMREIYQKINKLEVLVAEKNRYTDDLKSQNDYLRKSLEENQKRLNELEKLYKELETENKRIKVVSAISGNEEYKKIMKLQMNKLIREIDTCIIQLKNN